MGEGSKPKITGNDAIKFFERRVFMGLRKDTVEWKINFKQELDYLGAKESIIDLLDCPIANKINQIESFALQSVLRRCV